jgi:hypothetical protein
MIKVHPYKHMRPRRIDIHADGNPSYTVNRYAEDDDIRFGFGRIDTADEEGGAQIVEIDFSWLGVIFHILATSKDQNSPTKVIELAKDNIDTVKEIAKKIVVQHLHDHPLKLKHMLEIIHDASREQGHLEVVENTLAAMPQSVKYKNCR